eukprot:jgi/Chlat1/3089/Chrsp21S03321
MVKLQLEFSGGLELLFGNKKAVSADVPPSQQQDDANGNGNDHTDQANGVKASVRVGDLLLWMRDNLLQERPELFIKGDTVRPGILVLVNDCDWELTGRLDSRACEGDSVVFISTLHGG